MSRWMNCWPLFVSIDQGLKSESCHYGTADSSIAARRRAEVTAADEALRNIRAEKKALKQNRDERYVQLQTQLGAAQQPELRQQLTAQLDTLKTEYNSKYAELRTAEVALAEQKKNLENAFAPKKDALPKLPEGT